MVTSGINISLLGQRISASKSRILASFPFYGVLIMETKFLLDEKEKSFSTDGKAIYFNPSFLNSLNDEELDISILHEIFHIVFKHPYRYAKCMDGDLYHLAADIVVNSNIMSAGSRAKPLFVKGRELPYKTPDNHLGCDYTAEEVYAMLCKKAGKKAVLPTQEGQSGEADAISKSGNNDIDTREKIVGPKLIHQAFNYVPEVSGTIYFRTASYRTMKEKFDWLIEDEYECPNFAINPILFTSDKLKTIADIRHVRCKIVKDDLDYLSYPDYLTSLKQTYYDVESIIKKNEAEFDYFDIGTSQDLIDKLASLPFSNKRIDEAEKLYRKFVHANYLNVSSLHKQFFTKFAKDRNIQGDPKSILVSCRNAIAGSAKYDLQFPVNVTGKDDVLFFLCETKKGICYHFASALVMFYRALGIPSRIVAGYLVNGKRKEENFAFDESGHAWVEAYLDGTGWVRLDPTPLSRSDQSIIAPGSSGSRNEPEKDNYQNGFDTHFRWEEASKSMDNLTEDEINARILKAYEIQESHGKGCGKLPGFIESLVQDLRKPQVDWRTILNEFVQEDVYDYSFLTPDKRFQDSCFIMPSFSDKDFSVKDVLFMVDCSGSMSTKDITDCYSEIKGALDQYDGKLKGYMGFFDTIVYRIHEIDSDTDVTKLKPVGRGGTSFNAVFSYVKNKMSDNLPSAIIILTDGMADFPDESRSLGIPTLWIINNKDINPPWGKIARISH